MTFRGRFDPKNKNFHLRWPPYEFSEYGIDPNFHLLPNLRPRESICLEFFPNI